jgi:hypothetical protein
LEDAVLNPCVDTRVERMSKSFEKDKKLQKAYVEHNRQVAKFQSKSQTKDNLRILGLVSEAQGYEKSTFSINCSAWRT